MTNKIKTRNKDINLDAPFHVSGRTKYVDDIPEHQGTCYAKTYYSRCGNGTIIKLNTKKAEQFPGVIRVLTYKDVPGENQIGGIVADEPLLAEKDVHFYGQPILLIVAKTESIAEKAMELIEIKYKEKEIIVDPKEAYEKGSVLAGSRTFKLGNPNSNFKKCKYVFEGEADSGGQEHLYLETQGAYAIPKDQGGLFIHSSTQGPTAVQRVVAKVLGLNMSQVEINVNRIGGGFGGKEDQASHWAALAAFAAHICKCPVKLILSRHEDLQMTGKRHPYRSYYIIGLDENLKIMAYEATFYQNGGAAADLSPAVLERTLFHATNSYYVPNIKITAHPCKTNIPPNTAFRGFGGPQGKFVIEAAIHHAAKELKTTADKIQKANLFKNGDEFSFGQIVENCEAKKCWDETTKRYKLKQLRKEIDTFNKENKYFKKGIALQPICFGISFTNTPMNNARALVHVYSDGSVGVSTGAVEMGQGVNTKMVQVAAQAFGLELSDIRLEDTNTTRVANTSPTAASATADLNGRALQDACNQILERIIPLVCELLKEKNPKNITFEGGLVKAKRKSMPWQELVQTALLRRINMSAKGHYSTPIIHFDKKKEKGHPFAYHVYGNSIFVVKLDCIRGTYEFESVKIVHDFGSSMNKALDLGQIEGGLVQGMGWMTMEDVVYDKKGMLKSNTLATYKIPDVYFVPKELDVHFLNTKHDNLAILKSKAVGEPPLMYGLGAYFSIINAILAYNPNAKITYNAPITTEKILMALYT